MKELIGMGVALITPFNQDLTVDFEALKKLVRYNIDNGTNYLVISGTTAESATISKAEKLEIIKVIANENNGEIPLVLGVGGNNTASVIDELNTTDLSNIDAILSVAPYYSKPTQEGFYEHFKAISKVSSKPIILYNVPGRTGKNMDASTILRLANDFDNIVAVKEAAGNISQYYNLIQNKPKDFLIISGDDDMALPITLAGGSGVISVIGQAYPKLFSEMIALAISSKSEQAHQIHFKLLNMIGLIFKENNPSGIKAVLENKGICSKKVRLPLVSATSDLYSKIKKEDTKINNSSLI